MNPIVPTDALGAESRRLALHGEPHFVLLDHLVTHEEWERDWSQREERFEVVDGIPLMTPFEHPDNLDTTSELAYRLRGVLGVGWSCLQGAGIRIAGEPLLTYRGPDLLLLRRGVPRENPLGPAGVELVVEALSPSTRREDLGRKRLDYASVGIPNYLIIDRSGSPRLMLLSGPVGGDYPEPTADAVGEVVTLRIAGHEVTLRADDLIR